MNDEDFFVPKRDPRTYPEKDRQADEEYFRKKLHNALKIPETRRMDTDIVKKTFEEMGIPGFRPLRSVVLVRANPVPKKTGSIYLPEKLTSFFGELPHMQPITATVLAAGPKASLKPGETIAFLRLHFSWWMKLEDGSYVGWLLDEANIIGYADLDPGDTFADLRVESATGRGRMTNSG